MWQEGFCGGGADGGEQVKWVQDGNERLND